MNVTLHYDLTDYSFFSLNGPNEDNKLVITHGIVTSVLVVLIGLPYYYNYIVVKAQFSGVEHSTTTWNDFQGQNYGCS